MKNHLLAALLLLLTLPAIGQNSNPFLQPRIWLKHNPTDSITSFWKDYSGFQNNAYPTSEDSTIPPFGYLNFNPCFIYNGQQNPLVVSSDLGDLGKMTIIVVYQISDTTPERGIWTIKPDTSQDQSLTSQKIIGTTSTIKYRSSNDTNALVNTFSYTRENKDTDSLIDHFYIGGMDSIPFAGKLAECLLYTDILDGIDLGIIQSYLCLKYGVTLKSVNYVSSSGDTLWNRINNSTYCNGIIGLGKDTILGLDQKQSISTSSKDILTIAADVLAENNQANTYNINQGDYIILGNNKEDILIDWIDSTQTNGLLRRKWLVQATGSTCYQIPNTIKVNLSSLSLDSITCFLVISRQVDSLFNLGSTEYLLPDSITSDNIAYFSNIHWDTDTSGSDLFSFYFLKEQPLFAFHPNPSSAQKEDGLQGNLPNSSATSSTTGNPIEQGTLLDNSSMNKYRLFPNPTNGTYILDIDLKSSGWVIITINDAQGKVIQTFSGNNQQLFKYQGEIKQPGTYYVQITTDGEKKVFPLVVQ